MRFVYLFIFLSSLLSEVISQNKGNVFVQNYSAKLYEAHTQNWCALQDTNGIMYFGNTLGCLVFDGTHWDLIRLPNESAVFSMALDEKGRIYMGGVGELGYLEADYSGRQMFVSLKPYIPKDKRNIESVWEIIINEQGEVFFRSPNNIYIWNPSLRRINTISPHSGIFHRIFYVNKTIFTRVKDRGLFAIKNNKVEAIEQGERFADMAIYGMIGLDSESALVLTREYGFFRYFYDGMITSEGVSYFVPFKTDADEYLVKHRVYSLMVLSNTNIAIATGTGGVVIINKTGEWIECINEKNNLQNNNVRHVFEDLNKNLWISSNDGISYAVLNSPFRKFDKSLGLVGTIYESLVFNNKLYAAGSMGISVLKDDGMFSSVSNTGEEAFMLDIINGQLYAGDVNSIYEIKDASATKIANKNSWNLRKYRKSGKNYLLGGALTGIYVFEENGTSWTYKNRIKNFDSYSRYLETDENNNCIWVANIYKGIYRITFNDAMDSCYWQLYDSTAGLPSTLDNRVYKLVIDHTEEICFTTDNGVYQFDAKTKQFLPHPQLKNYFEENNEVMRLINDSAGNLYFDSDHETGVLLKQGSGYKKLVNPFFKIHGKEIENIFPCSNGNVLYSTSEGIFVYNQTWLNSEQPAYKSVITNVMIDDSLRYSNVFQSKQSIEFAPNQNSMVFRFSSLFFDEHEYNQFSYYLEGFDKNWSKWSSETKKEYTNLSHGTYVFHVKAKNIYNEESQMADFSFVIQTPWYKKIWALIIFVLIFALLIWLGIKLYLLRINKSKQELERLVQSRTAELQEINVILEEQNAEVQQQKEEILSQKDLLENQNAEITQQKEEIIRQKNEIDLKNNELEKLSLIVSRTDNAVIIADKFGDIEWVNQGFTLMYEQSLTDFKRKFGNNIFTISSNPTIKDIKALIYSKKKSVIYESSLLKSDGQKIFLQTTLTPILDENNEIKNFIAIDSDIQKIKEAKDRIQKQNIELEKKNLLINESIKHIKRLQQNNLPRRSETESLFDSFIIYNPAESIAGDFFFFYQIPGDSDYFLILFDTAQHGFLGAFKSVIWHNAIKEIIGIQHQKSPEKIMEAFVAYLIEQNKSSEEVQIYFDLIVCRISKSEASCKLTYSTINRPLFLFDENENLIKSLMPLNTVSSLAPHLNNTFKAIEESIELHKGNILYLTSDGITNQYNNQNQAIEIQRFIDYLQMVSPLELAEQRRLMEKFYDDFLKKASQQYDDITIWAVKLK